MTRRRYTEHATLILVINDFMKGKTLQPGTTHLDILPCGLNVWTIYGPDAVHISIGNDQQIFRTYQLAYDPIPPRPNHRKRYARWKLTDSLGKHVFRIFQIDGEIGSRHELRLFRLSTSWAARRQVHTKRNWKHSWDLLEFYMPILSVVREKPRRQLLSTWMREVMAARFGGYIYRDIKPQFEEALTMAENEYATIMNIRRLKYRNLERINAQRHQEKIERQQRADEGIDEPIMGFK